MVGKSGPSPNCVLAVLGGDGIQLEMKLAQKRQLLVEQIILPSPGRQIAEPHPNEPHVVTPTSPLAKQTMYLTTVS